MDAVRNIAAEVKTGKLEPADINEQVVSQHLYAGYPDPDLLIRTSGEMRVNNFLPSGRFPTPSSSSRKRSGRTSVAHNFMPRWRNTPSGIAHWWDLMAGRGPASFENVPGATGLASAWPEIDFDFLQGDSLQLFRFWVGS